MAAVDGSMLTAENFSFCDLAFRLAEEVCYQYA